MAPSFCSTRMGRNARVPLTTPWKLMSHSQLSSSGIASSTLEVIATPALLNTAPIGLRRPVADLCGEVALCIGVTDVEHAHEGRSVQRGVGLLEALLVDVGDGHRAAVRRKSLRQSAADAGRRAGDDDGAAADRALGLAHALLLDFGVGDGGPTGVVGDQVDDPTPCPDGQVVAEAVDRLQSGAWYRACGCGAAGRMDHPVPVAVNDQGRYVDVAELGRAVPRREDPGQLPDDPGRGSGPMRSGRLAHRVLVEWKTGADAAGPGRVTRAALQQLLVEREAVRTDVGEHLRGAIHRLGPRPRRLDVIIRRHVDNAAGRGDGHRWST